MILDGELGLGLRNPKLALRIANRLYYSATRRNSAGINLMDEDWDNLILLDGCRYDIFKKITPFNGKLRSVRSKGTATIEFLKNNFQNKSFPDAVYITSNPQLYRHSEEINVQFHDVRNVWMDSWNEEYGTVLPETMTKAAKAAASEYPNKRLLIHYIQPHYPFIDDCIDFGNNHLKRDPDNTNNQTDILDPWMRVMIGDVEIDRELIWDAYVRNLSKALDSICGLVDILSGKTVISSDHGNMFGERASPFPIKEWGHPRGIFTEELAVVPWMTLRDGHRRTIRGGTVADSMDVDEDVVSDRLNDLGYI